MLDMSECRIEYVRGYSRPVREMLISLQCMTHCRSKCYLSFAACVLVLKRAFENGDLGFSFRFHSISFPVRRQSHVVILPSKVQLDSVKGHRDRQVYPPPQITARVTATTRPPFTWNAVAIRRRKVLQ
jgi:hypothetical protein